MGVDELATLITGLPIPLWIGLAGELTTAIETINEALLKTLRRSAAGPTSVAEHTPRGCHWSVQYFWVPAMNAVSIASNSATMTVRIHSRISSAFSKPIFLRSTSSLRS